jgi:DNA-binding MarR family transcriptional regulator
LDEVNYMPEKNEDANARLRELFRRLHASAVLPFRHAVAATGCPERHAQVLALLHERGPLGMSGLSEALGIAPPQATALVDSLVDSGLVARGADAADRRRVIVEISEAGLETLERFQAELRVALDRVINRLPAAKVGTVTRGLETLLAAIDNIMEDIASGKLEN